MKHRLNVTLDARSAAIICDLTQRYRRFGNQSRPSEVIRRAIDVLDSLWGGFDDDWMIEDEIAAYDRRQREYELVTGQSIEH